MTRIQLASAAMQFGMVGVFRGGMLLIFITYLAVAGYGIIDANFRLDEVVVICIYGAFIGLVGAVVSFVASLASIVFLSLLNWSLKPGLTPRLSLCISGSLAGYLATAFLSYPFAFTVKQFVSGADTSFSIGFGIFFFLFVTAAMLVGHIGALRWVARNESALLEAADANEQRFILTTRHLLVLMTWFALLSLLVSLAGIAFLIWVGQFLVLQTIVLGAHQLFTVTMSSRST